MSEQTEGKRVICQCKALEADPVLRRVGARGGVTVTCPRREYCWNCHTELTVAEDGTPVAEAMVPRAALEWLGERAQALGMTTIDQVEPSTANIRRMIFPEIVQAALAAAKEDKP